MIKTANKDFFNKDMIIKQIELDKTIFAVHQIVSLDAEFKPEVIARLLEYHLEVYVLGETLQNYHREIVYPLDWWQAFKERWFPFRWRIKWPVKHKRVKIDIDIKALYPELSAKVSLPKVSLPKESHVFKMLVKEST